MQVHQNISLQQYNSFGIDAKAKLFADFSSTEQLQELLYYGRQIAPQLPKLILGGGSNLLFTKDIEAFVLKNEIIGIEIVKEDDAFVYVRAGAGESWHGFVQYCTARGWGGVENLALIPGKVGASPMQNIGAYGVEIKDVFEELEAFHLNDKTIQRFSNQDCAFGYRESIFKGVYKNQFAIVNVTFKLRKQPLFNTSYGAINEELEKMGIQALSVQAIANAVVNIRSAKLPDPKQIGNAGSFFKNPSVSEATFHALKESYPQLPAYPNTDGTIKLAAGWLIEQCGWKGYRKGDAGCHAKQALVLVNYGHATGQDIVDLSIEIKASVKAKFNIDLETEVNIV